jgi:hypothetical protein
MSLASQDPQVIQTVGAKAFLTQMVAALQHLALCTVHLFTNDFTPNSATVVGDFHEPDVGTEWAEYVSKATTGWGAQAVDPTGRVYISATPLMEWVGPAIPFDQSVYGYFIKSAQAGTPLLYSVRFPVAKGMRDANAVLDLVPTFTLPNQQAP